MKWHQPVFGEARTREYFALMPVLDRVASEWIWLQRVRVAEVYTDSIRRGGYWKVLSAEPL